MKERRRHRRRLLERSGQISISGANESVTFDCVVKDISISGAQLFVAAAFEIPARFKLGVEGLSGQDCEVKWRLNGALGVRFLTPLSARE